MKEKRKEESREKAGGVERGRDLWKQREEVESRKRREKTGVRGCGKRKKILTRKRGREEGWRWLPMEPPLDSWQNSYIQSNTGQSSPTLTDHSNTIHKYNSIAKHMFV